MLQITDNNGLNIQADQNEKNQDISDGGSDDGGSEVGKSIENLSTPAKSAKS